ncbi:MAG: hypothetical protein RL701_2510 [Pseudomonadota bacterium]
MATTAGNAERLQRTAGDWRLEFHQLVYNSPTLLRPRRFSVHGEQAILQQLRELSGHEPLVRDTERLFRGNLPDAAYVVRDGRWFPELMPNKLPDAEPQPELSEDATPKGKSILEEVARRMLSLEASVLELQEKLDQALKTLTQAALSGARSPGIASIPLHPEQAATMAMPPLSAAMTSPSMPAMGAAEPSIQPAAPLPLPMSMPSAPARKAITLPAMNALTDLIRGLAGPEASLGQGDRCDWGTLSASQPVFLAVIQDNAGDEAGSMIFDLEGALRLAGALLMESEEVIESLLEEKVMSDEMLDAASEVCNTLTAALNKVSGNPHLRAGKMQPFTPARATQLATASKRDDYRYNQGGRLSLVAV